MHKPWALVPVLLLASTAFAAGPVNKSFLGGTAVKGYDVVAYFEAGAAREGSADFSHDWMGAIWHFESSENRDLFAKDPDRYAPQYGGYCAYAVAHGTTADIDPSAWRILEGRLFLNKSKNIQGLWEQDIAGFIERADASWPEISRR